MNNTTNAVEAILCRPVDGEAHVYEPCSASVADAVTVGEVLDAYKLRAESNFQPTGQIRRVESVKELRELAASARRNGVGVAFRGFGLTASMAIANARG